MYIKLYTHACFTCNLCDCVDAELFTPPHRRVTPTLKNMFPIMLMYFTLTFANIL